MIEVRSDANGVRVTIPRADLPAERVSEWVRWLEADVALARSDLTEEKADAMAEDLKRQWWDRNKSRFVAEE